MSNKKILVVFYSKTSTTKKVAECISRELNCDIEEIVDLKKRTGIIGYVKCLVDALLKRKTPIKACIYDPENYDIVVLGSPVWASHITPALKAYITKNNSKFKKIAYFCTQLSNCYKSFKISDEIERFSRNKPIGRLKVSREDIKNKEFLKKIEIFKVEILNSL
ncbi:flavodoxin family protein [Clostridium akagii]|uniref:flavodoxin family protein n=1 Tax=Clostridium akagii TaxID=91623 RepID=UPI00068C847A|nr:NAD(P)H-dependent oxidoreductase [Clostridium akagii]